MSSRLNNKETLSYLQVTLLEYKMRLVLINMVLCPFKVNSNTIELTVHPSCYCI